MNEGYIKESKIIEKNDKQKELELIKNIINVKEDLMIANRNYEFAEDELIDYYSYQIKANQSKLNYLLKKAKTKGIVVNMIKQMELQSFKEEFDVS